MKNVLLGAVLLITASTSVPAIASMTGINNASDSTHGLCPGGAKFRFLWFYVC